MPLVDIGANLTHDSFDADRADVLQRALAAGVSRIILTGSSEQSNYDVLALAATMPAILFATAGMHPHHASDYTDDVHRSIRRLLDQAAVVAVGECGLDYYRNFSPQEAQRHAFSQQLMLAVETGLPVFLHQRDAHDDFLELLVPQLPDISRAVAHCFTGNEAELRAYLELDLYIGITGWICDERRGSHLQEIVSLIPDNRLMIETDAPYLLPRSIVPRPRSRRNEPAHLTEVLRVVAAARGQTEEHVARVTTKAAETFFGLAPT